MAEPTGIPPPLPDRLVFAVLAAFLAAALLLRASTFGNPAPLAGDALHALVGQRMHAGLLPYVDAWDRAPFGLFAIHWAIAAVSPSPLAWQLAATAAAAMTALVIFRLVLEWGPPHRSELRAGILAGLAYLLTLGPLDGFSGQPPVFANFAVALAAWLVWRAHAFGQTSRLVIAAALCGCALTVEPAALFNSTFLLGFGLWSLHKHAKPIAIPAIKLIAIAAAPTLAIALAYTAIGHFTEFRRATLPEALFLPGASAHQAASLAVRIAIPVALAVWGLSTRPATALSPRALLTGWLLAGLAGIACPPHSALPWLVPLCAAAGLGFARIHGASVAFVLVILNAFTWYDPFDRAANRQAIAATDALASAVVHHDGGRELFVFDGPIALYALTGRPFASPLVLPSPDADAYVNVNVNAEVGRILARHPGAVVTTLAPRDISANRHAREAVQDYVAANCRRVALVPVAASRVITPTAVYGDCRASPTQPAPDRIPR